MNIRFKRKIDSFEELLTEIPYPSEEIFYAKTSVSSVS